MSYSIQAMDDAHARLIACWRYPAPYDIYNLHDDATAIAELVENDYYTIESDEDELLGFFCLGKAAQVPAGDLVGAYPPDGAIDVGVGMHPDLTGKGFGFEFFSIVLQQVAHVHPGVAVRLTVATFNRRAIRLYENCGFVKQTEFAGTKNSFQTMVLPAHTS